MAVIQMLLGDSFSSVANLSKTYQEQLIIGFTRATTVVDVFDRFDNENSVKAGERERHSVAVSDGRQYHMIGGRSIPP